MSKLEQEEMCRFRTALRRFAIAITALNLLGHTVLGFEQSTLQPLVSLGTAYVLELLLAWLAPGKERQRAFGHGLKGVVEYLLPAHITGLAVSMLLYANERLGVIAFASAVAIGSKVLFRVSMGTGRVRHFFNPSNFGIAVTLLLFPWVGVAPPYQFTEDVAGPWDALLPVAIVCTGSLLNWKLTRRMPLIAGWLGGFLVQALLRYLIDGTQWTAALMTMTGVAFVLFTFYMLTDPMTTPGAGNPVGQVMFGASVAALYGCFVWHHVVFGMFFALAIVCAVRGASLYMLALYERTGRTVPDLGMWLVGGLGKPSAEPALVLSHAPEAGPGFAGARGEAVR